MLIVGHLTDIPGDHKLKERDMNPWKKREMLQDTQTLGTQNG